jgi:hypothetical protein
VSEAIGYFDTLIKSHIPFDAIDYRQPHDVWDRAIAYSFACGAECQVPIELINDQNRGVMPVCPGCGAPCAVISVQRKGIEP